MAWSIELALKVPAISSVFSNTFNSIDGAEAFVAGTADSVSGLTVDGNTVNVEFAKFDPNFTLTFAQFPILPAHLLNDVEPLEFQQQPTPHQLGFPPRQQGLPPRNVLPCGLSPVGSGPFKIAEVQMNDYVRFVPFAGYHGGVAKIDEIVAFPSGENDANVLKNAASKRLDLGFTKSVSDVQGLQDLDHMRVIPANIPYTRSFRVNKYPNKP